MSLHPIETLNAVIAEYEDHIQSEVRARDEQLQKAMETELKRPLFLAQESFYQARLPFKAGHRWDALPIEPTLAKAMVQRTGQETAYSHQSEAITHLLRSEE